MPCQEGEEKPQQKDSRLPFPVDCKMTGQKERHLFVIKESFKLVIYPQDDTYVC